MFDDARAVALKRALTWAARAAVAGKLVKPPRGKKKNDAAFEVELERAAQSLLAEVKLPGELYLVRWGGTRKGAGTFYTRPQLTLPTVRRTLEPLLVDEAGTIEKPEAILALKVSDPAMGSGSFLVAALRVLTEAVVRALHEHGRVEKTTAGVRLDCALLPEADRDQPEERVEAIVRRAVVEHCIYGVDRDRLAVELARVALWVETLDKRLPFTFLDHKLRCGDALIGTWIDRFRHYPLLAWWRQSPDEKWKGVTHEPDQWAKALKERRNEVVAEQAELLSGQRRTDRAVVTDEALMAAFERVRGHYKKLRKVPAGRPDERARIWREQVRDDPALAEVRAAFDLWCALWFWPLDRLADAPSPLTLASPSDDARAIVKQLQEEKRFFHWELEFPDVFTEKGAGFDAIVANPPWEIRKPSSKEFFTDLDPLYRSYGKQEALVRQRELFQADAAIEQRWLEHLAGFKDAGNFVRHAAEPFGDAEDDNGKPLVSLVPRKADASRAAHKKWRALRKSAGFSDPEHPFRHQGSADLNSYKQFVEQGHALLTRGGQLGMITPSGLYTDKGTMELRRLLLDRCRWRWLYGYENRNAIFDIHRSFKIAITIAESGYTPDGYGRWTKANEEALLALYQGSMIHQHDPMYKGWHTAHGKKGSWTLVPWSSKQWLPKLLIRERDYAQSGRSVRGLKIGFRDIARSTDERTTIAAAIPDLPTANVVGVFVIDESLVTTLSALLNSFAFDYAARARISGTHLNYYVAEELPLPPRARVHLLSQSNRLSMPLSRFAPWHLASTNDRVWQANWGITPHERLRLRCILDAIVAALYGLSRDDLRWILRDCDHPVERVTNKAFARTLDPKGFWRVDKSEHPELRHTVLTLVAFDALERLITEHDGDRDKAIDAFANLNDGEGWMLPDTLRLRDHDLGHDERAKRPQPVASVLGERFYDWQLAQTPEESWAECERHARAILGDEEYERRFVRGDASNPTASPATKSTPPTGQLRLIE